MATELAVRRGGLDRGHRADHRDAGLELGPQRPDGVHGAGVAGEHDHVGPERGRRPAQPPASAAAMSSGVRGPHGIPSGSMASTRSASGREPVQLGGGREQAQPGVDQRDPHAPTLGVHPCCPSHPRRSGIPGHRRAGRTDDRTAATAVLGWGCAIEKLSLPLIKLGMDLPRMAWRVHPRREANSSDLRGGPRGRRHRHKEPWHATRRTPCPGRPPRGSPGGRGRAAARLRGDPARPPGPAGQAHVEPVPVHRRQPAARSRRVRVRPRAARRPGGAHGRRRRHDDLRGPGRRHPPARPDAAGRAAAEDDHAGRRGDRPGHRVQLAAQRPAARVRDRDGDPHRRRPGRHGRARERA